MIQTTHLLLVKINIGDSLANSQLRGLTVLNSTNFEKYINSHLKVACAKEWNYSVPKLAFKENKVFGLQEDDIIIER